MLQCPFLFKGKIFQYNYPDFYDKKIPDFARKKYTDLMDAFNGVHVTSKPGYMYTTLRSLANVDFLVFAKAASFDDGKNSTVD